MYHHQTHWSGCLISSFSLGNFLACLLLILMLQPPLLISKKKNSGTGTATMWCYRWSRAIHGLRRFGNLNLLYFHLFYTLLSSLLYIYDLPKLFLYHLIVTYMWQHELICWDIIVLMKRSWKLLWGFAEPNTAHILADAFTGSKCQNFTFWMFKVCLIQTIMFYVI